MRETVFEREGGRKTCTVTAGETWSINLMKRLKERFPEEVDIVVNQDGSIFGHVPAKWMTLKPPKQYTEETKEKMRQRGRELNAD